MLANILSGLDRQSFAPIVVCPAGDVVPQLESVGAEVWVSPKPIHQFLHYTGYARAAFHPSFIWHAYGMWRDSRYWQALFRKSGARVVVLNALTLAPLAYAARRAGARVICVVQETRVKGAFGVRTKWLSQLLSGEMDGVVFISEYDRIQWDCRAPVVKVIPNWVDLSAYNRHYPAHDARRELGIPPTAKVALMMGGVSQIKGTLPLVRAAARLRAIDDFFVLIAGYSSPADASQLSALHRGLLKLRRAMGVEYHQRVLRAIKLSGMADRIRFLGMRRDVSVLYAAADVIVFPSTVPHQARPVLEAGAMAKPVVVPDFEQTREFVRDRDNGLTYRPGDVRDLADAIASILSNQELATALGASNYEQTAKFHNSAVNVAEFNELLGAVAAATS
jgi:glycosyltransferase involved in cell wall biosynthesis